MVTDNNNNSTLDKKGLWALTKDPPNVQIKSLKSYLVDLMSFPCLLSCCFFFLTHGGSLMPLEQF